MKMELKKILNFVIGFLFVMSVANAATYFDLYQMSFADAKPNHMQIQTLRCDNALCSAATPIIADYYKGDAIQCWIDHGTDSDDTAYLACMEDYKLTGNTLNLYDPETISSEGDVYLFAKVDTNVSFGYVSYFFTEGDTYMANLAWTTNFNCAYDTCVALDPAVVSFVKGGIAIAEIGQLNIKNVDNPLLPVQVEIPVVIEETVCSAYRFTQPGMYRPLPPVGYSDYSANTKISLKITNEDNGGAQLYSQEITIPILADTCAGLAAFSWTAGSALENTEVKFRVETEVIDHQVTGTIKDWTEVFETVYPNDLDGACWARSYDFTLSNIPSTEMTTSVAIITQGESLYAIFDAGAYRDQSITPMQYDIDLFFDNTLIYSNYFTSQADVQQHVIDLTNQITGLPTGQYEVKLVTTPRGTGCSILENVVQVQNLQILAPAGFDVRFHIRDPTFAALEDANVNFVLLDADDYYVLDPVYNENMFTDSNGLATFEDVIIGDYRYVVTSSDFETVTNEVHIGGPTDIYVTLTGENSAPIIDLPASFTQYYQNPVEFDIRDYIMDFNDDLNALTVSYNVISGTIDVDVTSGRYFSITDDAPSVNTLEVTVTDPAGARDTDTVQIIFVNNQAPVINRFEATPDNGPMPFTTTFVVDVTDADADVLTCSIDFGDGTSTSNTCVSLDNIAHTYSAVGSYIVTLVVEDGVNEAVSATEMVYVFETEATPIINYFNLVSSNGYELPTDLTLSWDVDHTLDSPMTCSLRVNGVAIDVPCESQTYDISNFRVEGVSRFVLVATDSDSNQAVRIIERNFAYPLGTPTPIINYFQLDSSNGLLLPTDLTLSWDVEHNYDYPITCTLSVNGADTFVPCTSQTYDISNFMVEGTSTFVLTAVDNESNEVMQTIEREFIFLNGSPSPVINYFQLDSSNGLLLPTDLTLRWDVSHNFDYPITCTLDINGVTTPVACDMQTYILADFRVEGASTFVLTAIDNESNEVMQTITQSFGFIDGVMPVIDNFELDSSNGIALPTNLTLSWSASHTRDYPITCQLNVNGDISAVACNGIYTMLDFTRTGLSRFVLTVIDNESNQAVRTITETFYNPEDLLLDKVETSIVMDNVVEPGEFTFTLETKNETLARRFINLKPVIVYGDVEIELDSISQQLDSSAVSRNIDDEFVFNFVSNTLDYEALIPKDEKVTFKLVLTDEFNSEVVLSKNITFSYADEEKTFASIRGKGTDIAEYMSSTMKGGGLENGYNTVKFNVVNNEEKAKQISISMISQSLGIEFKNEFNLGIGQTKSVTMPLFISDRVTPGMYPVRYTIRDGDDTQTRYSYILVKKK